MDYFTHTQAGPFLPEYEEAVRAKTHPNGRGNAMWKADEQNMLPQDKLQSVEVTIGKTTGEAYEFTWVSGRKDVYCVADIPVECIDPAKLAAVLAAREAHVERLKGLNHVH